MLSFRIGSFGECDGDAAALGWCSDAPGVAVVAGVSDSLGADFVEGFGEPCPEVFVAWCGGAELSELSDGGQVARFLLADLGERPVGEYLSG